MKSKEIILFQIVLILAITKSSVIRKKNSKNLKSSNIDHLRLNQSKIPNNRVNNIRTNITIYNMNIYEQYFIQNKLYLISNSTPLTPDNTSLLIELIMNMKSQTGIIVSKEILAIAKKEYKSNFRKEEFSINLNNYIKDKIISIVIKNITERSFNDNIIFNITINKDIYYLNNQFKKFPLKLLENNNELDETLYNITIFDSYFDNYQLYLYAYSNLELPDDFYLKIKYTITIRIREKYGDGYYIQTAQKEMNINASKKYDYLNGTKLFHCNMRKSISDFEIDYFNKIDYGSATIIYIQNIEEGLHEEGKIYIINFQNNHYYLYERHYYTESINKYSGLPDWVIILIIVILLIIIIVLIIIIYCIKNKKRNKDNLSTSKNNKVNEVPTHRTESLNLSENKLSVGMNIFSIIEYPKTGKIENPILILFKINDEDKLYIITDSNITIEELLKFYVSIKKYNCCKNIEFSYEKEILTINCKDKVIQKVCKNNNELIKIIEVTIIPESKCPLCLNKFFGVVKIAFEIITFVLELACLYCICRICSLSSKDPFQNQSIIDYQNYFLYKPILFNDNPYKKDFNRINKNSCKIRNLEFKAENETDYIDWESDILSENTSSNFGNNTGDTPTTSAADTTSIDQENFYDPTYTDKTSFCYDMYTSFINNQNKKFSYIFDLNYDTIKHLTIPTLIIFSIYLILYIIPEIVTFGILKKCKCKNFNFFCNKNINNLIFIKTLFWFAKSLLYYILWFKIERGDIGKYEDFLKCKFVNKVYFDDNFADITKLREYYIVLIIINLITEMLDRIKTVLESTGEEKEGVKPDESSNEGNDGDISEINLNNSKI